MKKVLVTGGCGFIGSHVVDKLIEKRYEVVVVDNLTTGKLENININRVKFYNCDITTKEFEEVVSDSKPDFIIHQAAQVSVSESIRNVVVDAEVNIKGSLNVINAAKNNGVKKIVFASSAAVYGEPLYLPVDINHPINPLSPYGLSKYTVENYLALAKKFYGVDYTILRYSNVYGPRQDTQGEGGVVAVFCKQLTENNEVLVYGDGEQTRDFIYVEDVADANVSALELGNSLVLNVSTSERITINDLYYAIKEQSYSLIDPTYMNARNGDIKHSVLCNRLTKIALNWEVKYHLDKGLQRTIEYYKLNKQV